MPGDGGVHPRRRPLWASTGTKAPDAPDTMYVEALAAPDAINTIPDKTLLAFADHGTLRDSVTPDGGDCEQVVAQFKKAGIDDAALAEKLQHDGAAAFVKSWKNLLARVGRKSSTLAMSARTQRGNGRMDTLHVAGIIHELAARDDVRKIRVAGGRGQAISKNLVSKDVSIRARKNGDKRPPNPVELSTWPDGALLDALQHAAFEYFPLNTHPDNGLIADTSREGSPCSIAVVGFGMAAYPVAVERGWIGRADAVHRILAALRFFRDGDQSGAPTATGYRGFYYHFLDMQTGKRVWRSELSMLDTSLLIAGALTAAQYFRSDGAEERELCSIAQALYRRIDWRWARDQAATIRMGWKPESGFLNYGWEGYTEAVLMYVLAMGSPTHPVSRDVFEAWTATYQWENLYGYDHLYAGPLFLHQFSHAWIDFRGIRDRFMRAKRSDYFENSRRATCIQREYARRNPHEFAGYGENGWGLSACEGPTGSGVTLSGETWPWFGYTARGVPYGPDDGTLSPPAVLAALPFAPGIVLEAMRDMLARHPEAMSDGRLASGVNPTLTDPLGNAWVSAGHYGLDQGVVTMMIENHRSGQIWRLMRDCAHLRRGLRRAGFRGGWLQQSINERSR